MPLDRDDNTRTHITLSKGIKVSHYTIIDKIGAGGMGEVYLAEDTKLKRKVALKFLPAQHSNDKDFTTRFTREAESTATLNHPNIITIHEVDEFNGQPFFAMELVEGLTLKNYYKDREPDIERIVEIAIQICDGLSAAHDHNIIHRDIKPSNIVIDAYGRPKILDFGLAAIQGEEHLTKTGSTLGTVGYMSPEQINGKQVDERSDLFSFGLILYELVAGKTPFRRDNDVATLKAITNDSPEPMARYKTEVPDDLQRIVSKLLEKDPAYRYQTAAGVVSDLKQILRAISTGEVSSQTMMHGRSMPEKSKLKVIVPTVAVIIIALLFVLKPWKFEISSTDEAQAANDVLAVMYFDNIVDSEDKKRSGEIITNLLISQLSESDGLKVVSSQRLYDILKLLGHEGVKNIDRNVASQVAERARARWMLTGSILRTDPSLVITAQLIEVPTGNIIASPTITGEVGEDIFLLAHKLTSGVSKSLLLPLANKSIEPEQPKLQYTNSAEAYRLYLEGIDDILAFENEDATKLFEKAIEIDSNFTLVYYELSKIKNGKENIKQAVELIDRVNEKEKLFILAREKQLDQNFDEAIKFYEQIIKKHPDEKLAYFGLALIYRGLAKRDYQLAMELLEKAIDIDPQFKTAYNTIAYTYAKLDKHEKSIWAINRYIELAPDEHNPYDSRGELYGFDGQLDKAIESYKKALEIKPDFGTSIGHLVLVYVLNRNFDEVDKIITRLATSDNSSDRTIALRARYQLSGYRGNSNLSLERMNLALEVQKLGSDSKQVIFKENYFSKITMFSEYALLDSSSYWLDSTQFYLDRSVEALKSDTSYSVFTRKAIYNWLSRHAAQLGDREAAYSYLKTGDKIIDTIYLSWVEKANLENRARVEYLNGNYDEALSIWEPLNLKEKSSFYMHMIGACYLKTGRLGEAVEMLEKGIKRVDVSTMVYTIYRTVAQYNLAIAYEESGWREKAITQYEEVIEIWSESDERNYRYVDAKKRLAKLKASS